MPYVEFFKLWKRKRLRGDMISIFRHTETMLQKVGPEIMGIITFKISFKSKEKCPACKFYITIEQTTNRGYEFSNFGSC